MARDFHILRSWLFVPGDAERKLARCWEGDADALIFDLEDAVAPPRKALARDMVRATVLSAARGRKAVAIRVNAVDTGLTEDDLTGTIGCRPDAFVLPKAMSPDDVAQVSRRIGELESAHGLPAGQIGLIPIVTEHPRAVLRLDALCSADPRTVAVIWGTEDLSAAMGARRVKDADGAMLPLFQLVRAQALLAASAAGLASIDTPVVELDAAGVLARESREAADMGFTGKLAIHPAQTAAINLGFLPTPEEIAYARELLAADAGGAGTFRFRGKMIDLPHLRMARRMVALAEAHAAGGAQP